MNALLDAMTVPVTEKTPIALQYKGPQMRDWETVDFAEDSDDVPFLLDEYMMAFKAPASDFRTVKADWA